MKEYERLRQTKWQDFSPWGGMRGERSERKMKSMVEKMMRMPHMHATETPFANSWGPETVYLCACVLCLCCDRLFLCG
jgi:hypothetical protein